MFTRHALGQTLFLAVALQSIPWIDAPVATAQPVVPVGSEMQVNSYTTATQRDPSVVPDHAGGFVVVWQGVDGETDGIAARRLDSTGTPTGAQFRVNEAPTNRQEAPEVTADGLGGFSVTWGTNTLPGEQEHSISSRVFDSADNPVSGDIDVDTTEDGRQGHPAIASLTAGGFVVVWADPSGPDRDIRAQPFDAAGLPSSASFVVNSYTLGDQEFPQIGSDGGDGLVVVWSSEQSEATDTDGLSVHMRRLDSTGQPLGQDFQVNSYTTGDQIGPDIGLDDQGGFVVAWSGAPLDGGASEFEVITRRFQSDGTPRGSDFAVSEVDQSGEVSFYGRMAPDGIGGFVVVWQSELQAGDYVYGRRVDAAAQPLGSPFRLSSSTADNQQRPSIATLADGDFVVVWDSNVSAGTDTSGGSIQARRFALDHDEDGVGTPVDTCTDTDGDGFGNPGFPVNTCPDDNCPDDSNGNQIDLDGDGIGAECDDCLGTNTTGNDDGDSFCNDLDLCLGDDFTGDGDGDGLCADLDCDDADATNACAFVFSDGFESGDTFAWTSSVP